MHRRAFTLLEVVIALAIVAMIASALLASLNVAFKARKSAVNNLSSIRQGRVAMEMIGRDLQATLPPTGVLAGAFAATPNDPDNELDRLDFFNTASPGPAITGAADVQHVVLRVIAAAELDQSAATSGEVDTIDPRDTGPRLAPQASAAGDGQYVLVRQVTRRLLASVTPEPSTQVVARHVRTFRVRLYDGTAWLDTWDSTTLDNTLPYAIEVTLEIVPPASTEASPASQSRPYTLTRVFPIHAAAAASGEGRLSLLTQEGR